jgi:hypothetical protein
MGHTGDSNKGGSGGHTFSDLVVPNAAAVDPGARPANDPNWVRKHQDYVEATTPQQKYS